MSEIKHIEYQIASEALMRYEAIIYNSTAVMFAFAIPLAAVSLGVTDPENFRLRILASASGAFIFLFKFIMIERVRIVYWDRYKYIKEMEKELGSGFWNQDYEAVTKKDWRIKFTPSPAWIRSYAHFLMCLFFLLLTFCNNMQGLSAVS